MPAPNLKRRGVTLIELIVVMLIITFGLVGLAATFSGSSSSLASNEVLQQASQYAQECAERVLAARRSGSGFAQFVPGTPFDCGTNPGGFTRSATVSDANATDPGACPNGITCRTITITVTRDDNTSLSSNVTVMLAQ